MGDVVGSVAGGIIGAFGSNSAAKKQARAAEAATQAQRQMFDRQVAMQEPFRQSGLKANNQLMYLLGLGGGAQGERAEAIYNEMLAKADTDHVNRYGIGMDASDKTRAVDAWKQQMRAQAEAQARQELGDPGDSGDGQFGSLMRRFSMSDFEADPGYQFRMTEGMRGVEGGAAARGGLLSGAALKAIQKYGQGLASQEYGNAYNRFTADQTNQYNRLAGLVNSGQGAANNIGNAAGQFGQAQANNLIGAGNAQASGIMGMTNAITGGINQYMNTQYQNKLLEKIQNPSRSGWGNSYGPWSGSGTVDALGDGVWG